MTTNPLKIIQKLLMQMWPNWSIQTVVLASLGFQGVLVFLAPLRKWSKSNFTLLIIWFVYLSADYTASFAIGFINNTDPNGKSSRIAAFWAAFLLLHLGGPHTITSFAMEDNDLWHRQMFTLIIQVFWVLIVFYRYEVYKSQHLLIPTAIVFVIGIVKYAERTRSLYLASLPIMRRSMREEKRADPRDDLIEQVRGDLEANIKEPDELEIVYRGYKYYQMFRGFIVDHTFIHIERDEAKKYFSTLGDEHAFAVMEVEVNFMYDAMFTKMVAVQWMSSFGYAYRFVLHLLLLTVAVMELILIPKHRFLYHDKSITYLLLVSAVVLDFIALVKLIFSEWTMAIMMDEAQKVEAPLTEERDQGTPCGMIKAVRRWVSWLKRNQTIVRIINAVKKEISSKKRWSRKMKNYSLINQSLKRRRKYLDYIIKQLGLTERIDSCQYTTTEPVESSLMKLVFEHVKKEGELHQATNITEQAESRGEMTADKGHSHSGLMTELGKICSAIEHHPYDIRVLILHVATEICYFTMEKEKGDPNPEMCKNISEYLAYLLVMEGRITSTVPGNVGIRFRDICWEEVEDTLDELNIRLHSIRHAASYSDYIKYMMDSTLKDIRDVFTLPNWRTKNAGTSNRMRTRQEQNIRRWEDRQRTRASQCLLWEVGEEDGQSESKSVLSKAVRLARDLKHCHNHNDPNTPDVENCSKEVWKCLSDIWVKLLLYAASHCRGDVQYLNKGGELLTFVRLLMAHFGLREWFKDEGGTQLDAEINQRRSLS